MLKKLLRKNFAGMICFRTNQTGDDVAGEPGAPEALGDHVPLAHAAAVHRERVRRVAHAFLQVHICGPMSLANYSIYYSLTENRFR